MQIPKESVSQRVEYRVNGGGENGEGERRDGGIYCEIVSG